MKTVFSRKNAMVRQFIRSAIRDWAVCRIGALCPSSSPATTTLTTPEEWSSSETMNVANGTTNEIAVSSTGSVTCLRTLATTRNTTKPIRAPPTDAPQEVGTDPPHRDAADAGRDRRTQGHQGGRVVEERLALEDRHDPAGQADPPADRGRGHGVRRRDDRADRERRPPVQVRQQRVHEPADAERGEHDQPDAEQEDRAPVGVEVDERGLDRGGVEQRRQQAEEYDVGGEVDRRARRGGRTRRRRRRSARAAPGSRRVPRASYRRAR